MIRTVTFFISSHRRTCFIFTLLLVLVGGCFSTLPTFDGNILGFDLNRNDYFNTSRRIDTAFGGQIRVYIKVTPLSDQAEQVFLGVHALEDNIKEKFPSATIGSLRLFYSSLLHLRNNKTSLHEFLIKAAEYPVLNDLISNDKKTFLTIVKFDSIGTFNLALFDSIISLHYEGLSNVKAISIYHVEDNIKNYIKRDFVVLSVVIVLFFVLFFLYVFRRFNAILFTASIVFISIFTSLFFFSLFRIHLNIVTILVLPVVLVLSLSDAMHLLSGFVATKAIENKTERIEKVLSQFIVPSFYSSLTTSIAFFTFYIFNDSKFIREFGLITAFCLMAEFFLTYLLAPFLMGNLGDLTPRDGKILGIGNFLERNRKVFSIAFIFFFIASFFMINKLQFKSGEDLFFPKGSDIYYTHQEFNKDFYSQMKLDILVEPAFNQSFLDSSEQEQMKSFVDSITSYFRSIKGVARVNSATDNYWVETGLGFSYNFLKQLGKRNPFYNKEKNMYRIELKVENQSVVDEISTQILPSMVQQSRRFRISYTSPVLIADYVNQQVSKSLVSSLLGSGISIFLMIFLLTRSIRITLSSLLPNLVPLSLIVFIYFALGLNINILTAITAVVCLGLLDDDTIHILYRRLWLKEPLEELTFSIISTSILLAAGFGIFYFSSFKPTQVFGLVSALVFIFGVICELTLLPWILNYWERNKNSVS